MKLSAAARRFDRTLVSDAYNPLDTFKVQFEPFDYYKIDGASVRRKVMSVDPSITMPARRVIDVAGQKFLVGEPGIDFWEGEPIRGQYVIQGADAEVSIHTIAQTLADTAGTTAWASIDFSKYGTDERDSSEYHPQYHIYFGEPETIPEDAIVQNGADTYLVRNSHRTVSGLRDAIANRLDSPVIDAAVFSSQTYDPITDTYTGTPTTVRCLRVRWQEHFEYLSVSSEKFERGDMQVLVPLSVTAKASDTFPLSDGVWRILAVVTRADYRMLHVRRA
jgi:hypothetical protein